ncbi:MAG TPA: sigma factor [Kofleriaceae bacterium]|nr:sigma factor [Kofleriaceae bacterium]
MTHGMEERLSSLLRDHARDELAALAVEAYGGELYGFLVHVVGEPVGAADVFAQMIEDLWRELPGFRGDCSVRTWLYRLAHQASVRHRPPRNRAAPAASPAPPQLVAAAHTMTASWRSEVDDRWRELRRELSPEDRALLVLRVDRQLAWPDIAQVMRSERAADAAGAVTHEATRLRARFQRLKDQLRVRARAAGLR